MNLKIAIDAGDYILTNPVKSGISRLINSFAKEASNNLNLNYYSFSNSRNKQLKDICLRTLPKRFFASFWLPLNIIKDRNNVFLGFSGFIPPFLNLTGIYKIAFVYDLGFLNLPQFYYNASSLIKNTKDTVNKADKIVVLSNYAKSELIKFFPDIREKVVRIYSGIDHLKLQNSDKKLLNYNYFLYVGVIKPIKNIEKLFQYFYSFLQKSVDKDYSLVLIGQKEKEYYQKLLKNDYYLKLKDKIVFLKDINDQDLASYYHFAASLLNFSSEEGFCFPVLEAASLGTPTVVNDLSLYKEYQKYFSSINIGKNKEEIVNLMIKTAKIKKETLPKIPKIFTWKSFASQLIHLFA